MPAAAKIEKPNATAVVVAAAAAVNSGEPITNGKGKANSNGASNQVQDPQKIVATIIEKKVRNLEKRKVRLLEIKALENKGQNLEEEQKIAVKKLDGVCETIDNLKEIGKHVADGLTEYSKSLKKQQKRESQEKQTERQQQESERIKLWLSAQFVLARLQTAKKDLLQGQNGAMKLEQTQVEALEKLVDVLSPPSVDVIESSAEKVQLLLEGNKREFTSGVSYSVLKETLIKLVASGYFEKVSPTTTTATPTVIVATEISGDHASADKEEAVKIPIESETVSVTQAVPKVSNEKPQEHVASKKSPQQRVAHPAPVINVNQQQQQQPLCFMRDQIADNDLHKDPAVVAVAPSGFAYPPHQMGQGLPTAASSGAPIHASTTLSSHYPPHMFPTASLGPIPSQTFTNPSYTAIIPGANGYIPVSMPGQISHPMQQQQHVPEANLALRNPAAANVSPIPLASEKTVDQQQAPSDNQFAVDAAPKEVPNQQQTTSQEAVDGKPVNGHLANGGEPGANGHYKRRGGPGRGRGGNYAGNANDGSYRGRGGRQYNNGNRAYMNGAAPNAAAANTNGNTNGQQQNGGQQQFPQNRPQVHPRQTGPRQPYSGPRNGPRIGGNFPQTNSSQPAFPQAAPVPAK